jgi:transitional endoplasmic reticulum ATPase
VKTVLISIWERNAHVVTILTTTSQLSDLPAMFHCLDGHGLFTDFIEIKSPKKLEIIEIAQAFLNDKLIDFEHPLLDSISDHLEGCVFKDIEKLIEQVIFKVWSKKNKLTPMTTSTTTRVSLADVDDVVYNYLSINMMTTQLFKSKNKMNWQLIGGLDDAKLQLTEAIIWPMKYEKFYKKLGMKQSTGTLVCKSLFVVHSIC